MLERHVGFGTDSGEDAHERDDDVVQEARLGLGDVGGGAVHHWTDLEPDTGFPVALLMELFNDTRGPLLDHWFRTTRV